MVSVFCLAGCIGHSWKKWGAPGPPFGRLGDGCAERTLQLLIFVKNLLMTALCLMPLGSLGIDQAFDGVTVAPNVSYATVTHDQPKRQIFGALSTEWCNLDLSQPI